MRTRACALPIQTCTSSANLIPATCASFHWENGKLQLPKTLTTSQWVEGGVCLHKTIKRIVSVYIYIQHTPTLYTPYAPNIYAQVRLTPVTGWCKSTTTSYLCVCARVLVQEFKRENMYILCACAFCALSSLLYTYIYLRGCRARTNKLLCLIPQKLCC